MDERKKERKKEKNNELIKNKKTKRRGKMEKNRMYEGTLQERKKEKKR